MRRADNSSMVPEVESCHVTGIRAVLVGRLNPPVMGKRRSKGAAEAGS